MQLGAGYSQKYLSLYNAPNFNVQLEMNMFFEGQAAELRIAMKQKQQLLNAGEPNEHIRILRVTCGGVLKGVYGGGAVTALHEKGYGAVFDWTVGLSTGGPTECYALSGQPWLGTSIYWEECCTEAFIDKRRILRNFCDTDFIVDVFERSPFKRLDVQKVLEHRTKLFLAVTVADTAKQRLVNPQTAAELFAALRATVAIPGASEGGAMIGGQWCVDGSMADPLPLPELIKRFEPTHVLVITNRESGIEDHIPLPERILNDTLWRSKFTPLLREAVRERRLLLKERIQWLRKACQVPWLIVWGDGTVRSVRQQPVLLKAAAERSRESWYHFLDGQK